jgi:hypothetical protein
VPDFYADDQVCNNLYTVTIDASTEQSLVTYNAYTRSIAWSSPAYTGVHKVTFYSAVVAGDLSIQQLFAFTLTVTDHRALQTATVVATTIPNIDYTIDTTVNHFNLVTLFTTAGGGCGNDNVYYKLSATATANAG